ncbi:MAG: glycoside hydrolase family 2 TIM barrel-domain containing protein, partial [Bacteroidota bacterium]
MSRQLWDGGWLFHLGDARDAARKDYDDTGWRAVDLPHDYGIEQPRDPRSPSGAANGFFPLGVGWYRKRFILPPEVRDRKVFVEFEGVYMNAETWCNGHFVGRHPYGYTSFHYDLTPYVAAGEENVLAVRVDSAAEPNSRWYSGSGIYRHVWLRLTDPVHLAQWGIYVTTPTVTAEKAVVSIRAMVENESGAPREAGVRWRLRGPDGEETGRAEGRAVVAAEGRADLAGEIEVPRPSLWSVETPNLYTLETELLVDGRVADAAVTRCGIRSISFDAARGFLLNGRPLKLRGGCVHHDNGPLGAASYDRAEERRVELLKANGFNAVRCAHNPPAPAFLDACDRLGLLVIDEAFDCWRAGKNPYDYHTAFDDWWRRDLESMVRRDWNHPSVIMWSIGNELVERGEPEGARIAKVLADYVRGLDPTRPVTAAINGVRDWTALDDLFAALDVCGYNYELRRYRP